MKHGHAWALGLLALTLTACGGSSHPSSSTTPVTTTGPGLTSDYRIEAVLADTSLDPNYIFQDPLDIQTLDSVQFQLVNYPGGTASSRSVATTVGSTNGTAASFTTNDTLDAGGVLTPGGAFTASQTDSGSVRYIVSANYQGNVYSAFYRINPRLNSARVRGKIVSGGTGVYNAEVDVYGPRNSSSTRDVIIATVRTGPDGTFRASIPLPAGLESGTTVPLSFTVIQPTGFGSTFTYNGSSYTTSTTGLENRPTIDLPMGDTYLYDPSLDATSGLIELSSGNSN